MSLVAALTSILDGNSNTLAISLVDNLDLLVTVFAFTTVATVERTANSSNVVIVIIPITTSTLVGSEEGSFTTVMFTAGRGGRST
ncbi:hypothetical protein G6F42_018480 [Rhizopus arrhizus]|nr:hypothetical protein G6F42_018480 [Rhizopus arrhizus]